MRARAIGLLLSCLAAACGALPSVLPPGVHEVDGYWIGTEHECDPAKEEAPWSVPCSSVVRDARRNFQAANPGAVVVRGVMADIPDAFTAPDGRRIESSTHWGISTRTLVVLDLLDGSRRVVGQVCYIAHTGHGFRVEPTDCRIAPLSELRVSR